MQTDKDKRESLERRSQDRRVTDDPGYNGPDRRKDNRRTGEDRRSTD